MGYNALDIGLNMILMSWPLVCPHKELYRMIFLHFYSSIRCFCSKICKFELPVMQGSTGYIRKIPAFFCQRQYNLCIQFESLHDFIFTNISYPIRECTEVQNESVLFKNYFTGHFILNHRVEKRILPVEFFAYFYNMLEDINRSFKFSFNVVTLFQSFTKLYVFWTF